MHPSHSLSTITAIIAPAIVVVGYVLNAYAPTAAHWTVVLRPIVLGSGVAIILALGVFGLGRRAAWSGALVVLAVMFVAGIDGALPVAGIVAAWTVWGLRRWFHAGTFPKASGAVVAVPAAAYLLVGIVTVAIGGAVDLRDFSSARPLRGNGDASSPNIYVFLLDGYPRADTLARDFGYDNRPFLDRLKQFGFTVYGDSESPHDATSLTMLRMLSGETADLGSPALATSTQEYLGIYREVRRRLSQAPALGRMRDAGYELVYVPSAITHVFAAGWDITLDSGNLNEFEQALLAKSPLARMLAGWVMDQQRARFEAGIAAAREWMRPDTSRVVLVHLLAPHPPFMYDGDGAALPAPPCWPRCALYDVTPEAFGLSHAEFRRLFAGQTTYVNRVVGETVETIIAGDPDAIVVVMSDHGARWSTDNTDPERFRNLLTVRLPGKSYPLGSDHTPDRLFDRLLRDR